MTGFLGKVWQAVVFLADLIFVFEVFTNPTPILAVLLPIVGEYASAIYSLLIIALLALLCVLCLRIGAQYAPLISKLLRVKTPDVSPKPEKPPKQPLTTPEIRPTPTPQQDFIVSLAQEPDNIRMQEIRVRLPTGAIYQKAAYFYTVAIAIPSGSENAPDFKLFFRKPNSNDIVELLRIGTSGVKYLLLPWTWSTPFGADPLQFAAAIPEAQIRHPQLTLTASPNPHQLVFSAFVFLYTIDGCNRLFVPTFNAWDTTMPTKFRTEVWAEANNRTRRSLVK
ncbi:MAG: hypothetical protein ABSD99_12410, partial [Candidatus Bathyarchaeia archaeon]